MDLHLSMPTGNNATSAISSLYYNKNFEAYLHSWTSVSPNWRWSISKYPWNINIIISLIWCPSRRWLGHVVFACIILGALTGSFLLRTPLWVTQIRPEASPPPLNVSYTNITTTHELLETTKHELLEPLESLFAYLIQTRDLSNYWHENPALSHNLNMTRTLMRCIEQSNCKPNQMKGSS